MKGGRCTSSSAAPPPFIPSSAVFPSSGPHLPLPQSPGHPKRDPCSQRPSAKKRKKWSVMSGIRLTRPDWRDMAKGWRKLV
ncbi:hypothetical protein DICSQDRAFT_140461, partial [Dichomitus squalens LYAD-421 SS1]